MRLNGILIVLAIALAGVILLGLLPDGIDRHTPQQTTQVVKETPTTDATTTTTVTTSSWSWSWPAEWFERGVARAFAFLLVVGLIAIIARWGLGMRPNQI